jgi:hypothetical protein
MDFFSRDDLRTLLGDHPSPCISLHMRTTRGPGYEDKTRWKNLLRQAEESLASAKQRSSEVKKLLQPAHDLLDKGPFWQNVSAGLAMFLASGFERSYRLPARFRDQAMVGDRFHIKPLLAVIADNGRFFVLALSQKQVRLLQGTRFTVQEIHLQGVPGKLSEALQYNDEVRVRTFHTHTASGGPASRREAIVHGHGAGVDSAKDGLLEYFQQVDRGLHRYLHNEQAPLVLAGADFLLPIYREANSYPHLLDEGIEGHPDRLSNQELHDRAWELVQPQFQETRHRLAALYRQLAGTGRTSNDLPAIVAAAYQGHIQYLFVADRQERWGTFDQANLRVEVHEAAQVGDEDLLNLAAVYTLSHKGTVYAVEPGEMPDAASSGLAALFWLPAGQRSSKRTV